MSYTRSMLDRFDRLTNKLSSLRQMDRIEARCDIAKFEKEHGTDVCNEMFAVLTKRDRRKNGIR
jgi:hypothetical protein